MTKVMRVSKNQEGIVSIIVTMIIMIVLTLIVTGFAQLARREQREALDRQLSSQAFYAAESGINDARRAIANGYTGEKKTCDPVPSVPDLSNNKLDGPTGVMSYSCLLIKQALPDQNFQNVSTTKSTVVPLNSVLPDGSATSLDPLTIKWNKSKSVLVVPPFSSGNFPNTNEWGNSVGIMRIDIIPALPSDASYIQANTLTSFLYPTSSAAGTVSALSGTLPLVSDAKCGATDCSITITGLSGSSYFLRMKMIYSASDVLMCGGDCKGSILLTGGQKEIDSTGKANDVLKRIKVRVSPNGGKFNSSTLPPYAMDSFDGICKSLSVYPGNATTDCKEW